MKKILITGANSYIGTSFEAYMQKYADYIIHTLDMTKSGWENYSFSGYDVVFHVAGIAHSDISNVSDEIKAMYYRVNTDLTLSAAKKAKSQGVSQFIFMSSMIVYGSGCECITHDTIPSPDNFYGDSKLQADEGIQALNDGGFKAVSIRPPMIYGPGSKGNYPRLSRLAKSIPFFPDYNNKRSMLYVGNLCEFIRLMIDNSESGIFFPQNREYVKTADLVREIARSCEKRIVFVRIFNPVIRIMTKIKFIKKYLAICIMTNP